MDNTEKMATSGTQYENKAQHKMCWTPLCASKHKKHKQDMSPLNHFDVIISLKRDCNK